MLTNACKYAIRAVIYLGMKSSEQDKIGAQAVAQELEVPQPFLAQVLRQLAVNQMVSSAKGPGGGFYMNEKNLSNTLWDIIVSIDGEFKFDDCFLGMVQCNNVNPCPIHHIVSPFKEDLLSLFKNKSIEVLVEEVKKNGTIISLKGVI